MYADQRVQPGDALQPFGQPRLGQPATGLVDELNIVMILGPVITHEQHHRLPPSPLDIRPPNHGSGIEETTAI
jgi:hypothetical protein